MLKCVCKFYTALMKHGPLKGEMQMGLMTRENRWGEKERIERTLWQWIMPILCFLMSIPFIGGGVALVSEPYFGTGKQMPPGVMGPIVLMFVLGIGSVITGLVCLFNPEEC